MSFDPGYVVGGQLGYIFGSVRAEAEIEYNEADLDKIGGSSASDSLEVIRGTGGLYFDFVGFTQSRSCLMSAAGSALQVLNLAVMMTRR